MELSSSEDLILKILRQSNFATIQQIAKLSGLNRVTASKYLSLLEAKGLAVYSPVGRAKLYAAVEGVAE